MARKAKNKNDPVVTFEEQMNRLEEIVGKLESEEISLEKALDLFEEGTAIVKSAQKKLKESRLKVQKVLGEEGDNLVLGNFPFKDGEGEDDDTQ